MVKNMWMVRAGEGAYLIDDFKKKNIVAIGWLNSVDLSKYSTSNDIKKLYLESYQNEKKGSIAISVGQISRFRFEFKKEDYVLSYNPDSREYLVGEIESDYEFNKILSEYHHIRKVKWLGKVSRDKLSTSTRNTLGAISTIFEINDVAQKEIISILQGKEEIKEEIQEEGDEEKVKEDMVSSAHELIKDNILKLDWEDMEKLVAGILRAMGYKTFITERGADRGRDIEASPDGLMLSEPKIIVEVKHRDGQMGSKEIRNFIGVLRQRHNGIYVSTGGFSKEAKLEAERANVSLTLVDSDKLVDLIIEYYDSFDINTQLLIPLAKIYWPT